MDRHARHSTVQGFTLVEILVVIGIIALLIAILMPSLSRARAMARRIVCMSNQRQLVNGWMMYAGEYRGYIPLAYPDGGSSTAQTNYTSDVKFIPWVIGDQREAQARNLVPTAQRTADWLLRAGSIYRYVRDVRVYRCPEHDPNYGINEINISYGFNNYLNGEGAPSPKVVKLTQVRRSSTTYATIDQMDMFEAPKEEDERSGIVYTEWAQWHIAPPAPRHSGGSCLTYADGHAEYLKWRFGNIWGNFATHTSSLNTQAVAEVDMSILRAVRGY